MSGMKDGKNMKFNHLGEKIGEVIHKAVFHLNYPGMVEIHDMDTLRAYTRRNVTVFNPHAGKSGRSFRATVTGEEKDGAMLLSIHGIDHRFMYLNENMLKNGWECFGSKY
jgi:hypothetical protein